MVDLGGSWISGWWILVDLGFLGGWVLVDLEFLGVDLGGS